MPITKKNRLLSEMNFEPGHRKYEFNGEVSEWEDIAAASALEKFYHTDPATDLRGSGSRGRSFYGRSC